MQLTFEGGRAMYLLTKFAYVGKTNAVSKTAKMLLLVLSNVGIV